PPPSFASAITKYRTRPPYRDSSRQGVTKTQGLSNLRKLQPIQFRVESTSLKQFDMRAALNNTSSLYNKDQISFQYRRKAVGNYDRGATSQSDFECSLNGGLRL